MVEEGQKIRVRWEIPDDMDVLWASHFVAQHTKREFVLTFFQASMPVLLDATEEELKELARGGIAAKAVARIALTPPALKELLEVLKRNWNTYSERLEEEDKE